jgi:hypothetical protein
MVQLELKHLVAYMPYALSGIEGNSELTLVAVSDERKDGYWILTNNKSAFGLWGQGRVKPKLRPLSDLKEQIQHMRSQNTIQHVIDYPHEYDELQYMTKKEFDYLAERHYDLFGLLHKGLAVPLI